MSSLEPTPEASDQAFLVGAATGGIVGNAGEMSAMSAGQATDDGGQGVQMTFLMTGGARVIELHEALFDGRIAAILGGTYRSVSSGCPPVLGTGEERGIG